MKPPPFLLLATLLFWGWLSDFLMAGAIMGVLLEGARFTKFRWDLDDVDFSRIWSLCVLLNVVLAGYVFTNNDAGGGLNGLIHGQTVAEAANSGALTLTRFLRWLPMTFFAFIAAQRFNARESVPLTGISIVLRWRRRKGDLAFAGRYLNIAYPYFIICLFSAGIHANPATQVYFWGQGFLVAWALWAVRPSRYGVLLWLAALLLVLGLGFSEMAGINQMQRVIQNFNSQWLERLFGGRTDPLQNMTSMGRIGQLKLSAKIVIRLESQKVGRVPRYLREASYRNYLAQKMTWFAGGTKNDFEWLKSEPDNTTWILLPGEKSIELVNIACYLNGWSRDLELPEGLLPLPGDCGRLEEIPANMSLRRNKNGAVLAAGRGLVIFDALYGSGATQDSPPDLVSTNVNDLTVPTNELPALAAVVSEMHLPAGAAAAAKRQAVEKFFLAKFTYSTWQGNDKLASTNGSPLTRFLLTSRSGHCEYFATAAVLLLRQLHIPARYAVGYYVHEPRGSGYIVRERDAHAWCLAWNDTTQCWEDFDVTPPSWVGIEGRRTHFGEWFSDFRSWLKFQYAKFRWRQANLQQYIIWALVPVILVLLYHIIFRRRGRFLSQIGWAESLAPEVWPGLDSEFYQLESKLAARGVSRQPGEPLSDWLERALLEPSLAKLRGPLRELLRLHYRHRFDPPGLSAEERHALKREARICLEALLQAKTG